MNRKVLFLSLMTAACGGAALSNSSPTASPSGSAVPHEGVWPEEGPRKWAPRATEAAITPNDLRTRLYQLADDSMMGRRIGELGNFKGTEYIASEFKRLGLKPAGDNGTYFQVLDYGPSAYDSAASKFSVGGAALSARTEWVPVVPNGTNGVSGSADLQSVPTIFAGRWGDSAVVLDPNVVRGKVAVFTAPTIVPRAAAPAGGRAAGAPLGAGGNFMQIRDPRATAVGAVAVIVAAADSMTTGARALPFSGRGGMKPAVMPGATGITAVAVTNATGSRIFGKPLSDVAVGTIGAPITATWKYEFRMSRYPARNVIAMLPGSDPARAGEYVLVGAHNDHEGVNAVAADHDSVRSFNRVMRPQGANDCRAPCVPTADQQRRIDSLIAAARKIRAPRRDSTMNGADDDGSGTVVMMEIAEKFAAERPARSIIFISHQGEEAGLLGSKWFVDHPTVPLDKIVAAHNMDMVGKGRVTDVKFGGPNSVQTLGARRLSRQFGDIIDSVNAIIKNPMALDKSWDVPANPLNRFCRSDQVNYVNKGIPVTYFSFGYAIDYHQITDEAQYIDYEHAARLGNFIHDVMAAIANRADRPLIVGQDTTYPTCR